jgi:hypothetical protein
MEEQQQASKKRKLDQVSNQQQSELDVDCNGGCYFIVTTNEDQSLNDVHQFLLPENIYDKYAAFISNFKPKIDVSDYEPFSNKEIVSFKELEAIKDFFNQCDLAFPGEDSNKPYDEDATFDNEFTFDYLWLKVVEYWIEAKQVIKLKHGNRIKNVQALNVLQIVFSYDN